VAQEGLDDMAASWWISPGARGSICPGANVWIDPSLAVALLCPERIESGDGTVAWLAPAAALLFLARSSR
jgi:hypothetical protein